MPSNDLRWRTACRRVRSREAARARTTADVHADGDREAALFHVRREAGSRSHAKLGAGRRAGTARLQANFVDQLGPLRAQRAPWRSGAQQREKLMWNPVALGGGLELIRYSLETSVAESCAREGWLGWGTATQASRVSFVQLFSMLVDGNALMQLYRFVGCLFRGIALFQARRPHIPRTRDSGPCSLDALRVLAYFVSARLHLLGPSGQATLPALSDRNSEGAVKQLEMRKARSRSW